MLVTPELLIKFAREYVAKQLRQPNDIEAIYLTGSVLSEQPLIGGSTDIDLVVVHKEYPPVEREIQRVSYEISLDIQHHHQSYYTFHRRLRLNPWLGYALCTHGGILYDPNRWMDFIQAGVSASFNTAETIFARAQALAEKARELWFELEDPQELPFDVSLDLYFRGVSTAANALAVLSGPALTTRRFLLDFPARAEALDKASLSGDLVRLIGNETISPEIYQEWRPDWEKALVAASKAAKRTPNLHSARKAYFVNSCDAMAESGAVHAAFWPMIETWRQAEQILSDDQAQQDSWHSFIGSMGFALESKDAMVTNLDAFIDQVEAVLLDWKSEYNL